MPSQRGAYEAVPNTEPRNLSPPGTSRRTSDFRVPAASTVDSLASDPLASAFDLLDSDSEDDWQDDRTRSQGSNSRAGPSSGDGTSNPSHNSESNVSQREQPSNRVYSLWNTMLNAINRNQSSENASSSRENPNAPSSDGVFGNLVAKEEGENGANGSQPLNPGVIDDENDDFTPADQPPTYEEASADATPSYWETTILATNFVDEVVVGNMAVGSPLSFAWVLLLTVAFGIPACLGFYLFHNTHALRGGAFCGFGVNLIELSNEMAPEQSQPPGAPPVAHTPLDPNNFKDGPPIGYTLHPTGQSTTEQITQPTDYTTWSRILLIVGIYFLLKGVIDYLLALRTRQAIRQQQMQTESAVEQTEPEPAEP